MRKPTFFAAAALLGALLRPGAAFAFPAPEDPALAIMQELGQLYHDRTLLGDPVKNHIKEAIVLHLQSLNEKVMIDLQRENAAKVGGELGQKWLKEADALEAEIDAKEKKAAEELKKKHAAEVAKAAELDAKIASLEAAFWDTDYGKKQGPIWENTAKTEPYFAGYGKAGMLRWQCEMLYRASHR